MTGDYDKDESDHSYGAATPDLLRALHFTPSAG